MVEMDKILEALNTTRTHVIYQSGKLSDLIPNYHQAHIDQDERLCVCIERKFEEESPPEYIELKIGKTEIHLDTKDGSKLEIELGEEPKLVNITNLTKEDIGNVKKAMEYGLTTSEKIGKYLKGLESLEKYD